MTKTLALVFSFVLFAVLGMKGADPVTWSYKLIDENTDHPAVQITADIASGYHLYDFNHGGMENPLTISVNADGATVVGTPTANKDFIAETDEDGMPAKYYTGTVTFTQKLKPTKPDFKVTLKITGQACNDSGCHNFYKVQILTGKAGASYSKAKVEKKQIQNKQKSNNKAKASNAKAKVEKKQMQNKQKTNIQSIMGFSNARVIKETNAK